LLIPLIKDTVKIPVIAAGGIGDGRAMMACFALGAEAVQIGSRFVTSIESSAHDNFKNIIVNSKEGDTLLTMKELTPVRLIKNKFHKEIEAAEERGASLEEIKEILGRARAKKGMFEGDLDEGELEIGQVSANINEVKPAGEIVREIWNDFIKTQQQIAAINAD